MSEVLARGSKDLAVARPRGAPVVVDGGRSKLLAREGSFRVYYTGASGSVPFKWEARPGTPKHPSAPVSSQPLPPLTPPPSYLSPGESTPRQKLLHGRHHSSSHHSPPPSGLRIVARLVPKLLLWKKTECHQRAREGSRSSLSSSSPRSVLSWSAAASSNSTSSSAISSPSASPVRSCSSSRRTRRARSRFSSFSSTGTTSSAAGLGEEPEPAQGDQQLNEGEGEGDDSGSSCSSTPGSGGGRKSGSGFSGCSANVVAVKRALMSVVVRPHGSAGASVAAPPNLAAAAPSC